MKMSNVCLLLGVVLCFLSVDWGNMRFLPKANAEGCYTGGGYICPGTSTECPSQRCIDTTNPGGFGPNLKCATQTTHGLGTVTTTTYHREEKFLMYPHPQHHASVSNGNQGREGLNEAISVPCKESGGCSCETVAEVEDPNQTPFCSPPKFPDYDSSVSIQSVNHNSTSCVGE